MRRPSRSVEEAIDRLTNAVLQGSLVGYSTSRGAAELPKQLRDKVIDDIGAQFIEVEE